MSKLTDLTATTGADDADLSMLVDVSDTSMDATGTNKKITWANIKATLKTYFDTLYQATGTYLTSANIVATITNGVTTNAPSEDAVFDALALKAPLISPSFTTPSLGVATATSINGATITSGTLNGSVTGTNTGDQTSIVGITGTTAQFNTALSDNDFATLAGSEALTNKTYNGHTLTAGSSTFTGTAAAVYTFPTASKTIAANDGSNMTLASQAIGDIITASSTTAFNRLADVATGQVLVSGGVGVAPAYSANPAVTTLELGAGSTDTTLSRASAGVLAVEGVNVLTTATGLPLSGGTMTGNITLGENTSIDLDPAGSADGKYSGICITGTAGATLAFGDLIYLAVADSRWELTDADATATAGTPLIGMCVLAAAADGNATKILLQGTIRADAKFPTLTIGAPAYVGETAGAIQTAIPTGADNVIRVVGRALTADELYFCPSQDHQITVA